MCSVNFVLKWVEKNLFLLCGNYSSDGVEENFIKFTVKNDNQRIENKANSSKKMFYKTFSL
jgi:hypothetical protein